MQQTGSADYGYLRELVYGLSQNVLDPSRDYLFETRLSKVLRNQGMSHLGQLVSHLRAARNPTLERAVAEAMTINETSFFRDTRPFELLRTELLPKIIEARRMQRSLRIWSAACSTGQEPYSLAMMMKDHFPILAGWRVEIVATDLSPTVLDRAREGIYSTFEVQRGLPIQMLIRHFDQIEPNWQIKRELRRTVNFRPLNLLEDFAVLGQFDIVLCRNVLIYFDQPTKTRILNGITRRIAPDGAVMLGGAESVFGLCDGLAGVPGLKGVYSHAKSSKSPILSTLPLSAAS